MLCFCRPAWFKAIHASDSELPGSAPINTLKMWVLLEMQRLVREEEILVQKKKKKKRWTRSPTPGAVETVQQVSRPSQDLRKFSNKATTPQSPSGKHNDC